MASPYSAAMAGIGVAPASAINDHHMQMRCRLLYALFEESNMRYVVCYAALKDFFIRLSADADGAERLMLALRSILFSPIAPCCRYADDTPAATAQAPCHAARLLLLLLLQMFLPIARRYYTPPRHVAISRYFRHVMPFAAMTSLVAMLILCLIRRYACCC